MHFLMLQRSSASRRHVEKPWASQTRSPSPGTGFRFVQPNVQPCSVHCFACRTIAAVSGVHRTRGAQTKKEESDTGHRKEGRNIGHRKKLQFAFSICFWRVRTPLSLQYCLIRVFMASSSIISCSSVIPVISRD